MCAVKIFGLAGRAQFNGCFCKGSRVQVLLQQTSHVFEPQETENLGHQSHVTFLWDFQLFCCWSWLEVPWEDFFSWCFNTFSFKFWTLLKRKSEKSFRSGVGFLFKLKIGWGYRFAVHECMLLEINTVLVPGIWFVFFSNFNLFGTFCTFLMQHSWGRMKNCFLQLKCS